MSEPSVVRVLGFAGSLRAASFNRALLAAAKAVAPPTMDLTVFDIAEVPLYNADVEAAGEPAAVQAFKEAIRAADGVLIVTPEYNHGVPGVTKNAVDWASRPFATAALRNKPAAVIGTSTGMFGAVWAQAELRKSLAAAGARVIDRELPVADAESAFAADGSLAEHDQTLALGEILAELLAEARPREPANA